MSYKIIIIEPNKAHMSVIKKTLEYAPRDYHFCFLDSPVEVMDLLEKENIHILICELNMPVLSGMEIFQMCENMAPNVKRILLTDASDMQNTLDLINNTKLFRIIMTPCKMAEDILSPVNEALILQEKEEKERIHQVEYKNAIQTLDDKFQVLYRAYQKNSADFQMIYQMIEGAFRGNLMGISYKREGGNLEKFFQNIFLWFVTVNYSEYKGFLSHQQNFIEKFHRPKEGKSVDFLQKEQGFQCKVRQTGGIFYSLYLLAGMYDRVYSNYHFDILFKESDKFIEAQFGFTYEEKEDGKQKEEQAYSKKEQEFMYTIVREILQNLTENVTELQEGDKEIWEITWKRR